MDIDMNRLVAECTFEAVRSSGSGGQNVNKVATKVILTLDVKTSNVLSEKQKTLIGEKLSNRINKAGVLQISGDSERTQFLNKRAVVEKLRLLLSKALKEQKTRIPSKPSAQSKEKRIDDKKRQSEKKQLRRNDPGIQ